MSLSWDKVVDFAASLAIIERAHQPALAKKRPRKK